jgi:hypothetical protein
MKAKLVHLIGSFLEVASLNQIYLFSLPARMKSAQLGLLQSGQGRFVYLLKVIRAADSAMHCIPRVEARGF